MTFINKEQLIRLLKDDERKFGVGAYGDGIGAAIDIVKNMKSVKIAFICSQERDCRKFGCQKCSFHTEDIECAKNFERLDENVFSEKMRPDNE